jgi:DNA end-binding protein Ku
VTFNEELKQLEEGHPTIDISEFLPRKRSIRLFRKNQLHRPDKGGARAYASVEGLQQTGRWALAKYAARGSVPRGPPPAGQRDRDAAALLPRRIRAWTSSTSARRHQGQRAEDGSAAGGIGAADEFHPENYRDEVADRIKVQIQKKIDGEQITAADEEKPRAQVIDLMEALKASLESPKPRAVKSASRMPVKAEQKRKPAKASTLKAVPNRARK